MNYYAYANEVSTQNGLPDYLCIVSLRESEVTDLITKGSSFLMWAETSIVWFNSSAPVFDFTAHTSDFIHLHT
jgi:hypothetical protein